MNVKPYEKHLMKFDSYVVHKHILLIVPPILLAIGTFGNVCSFIIFRRNIQKASTYSFLCVLAIADSFVLTIGLLRLWIGQFTEDPLDINDIVCKVGIFLGYLCSNSSVWLIVIVTIERFIVVIFPLKTKVLCNLKTAKVSITSVIVIFLCVNVHFLWSVKLHYYRFGNITISKCHAKIEYEYLVEEVWPWVDAGIYSFVPFFVIIILNCCIIWKLFSAKKHRILLRQDSSVYKKNFTRDNGKKRGEMSMKITVMLLTVSFTFLLTTLPMNLVLIHTSVSGEIDIDDDSSFVKRKLVETFAEMLMYVNHSINFFLYCTTGKKFRNQFKKLFCKCRSLGRFSAERRRSRRISSSFRLSSGRTKTTSGPDRIQMKGTQL